MLGNYFQFILKYVVDKFSKLVCNTPIESNVTNRIGLNMKSTYLVKMTAQNDLGREYSIVQITKNSEGELQSREYLYTSHFKGTDGKLDCINLIHKIKRNFN